MKISEVKIVIPSFKRAKILQDNTLLLLKNHNVPKKMIDIVVETEEMKEGYKGLLGNYNIIVSNTKGICEKRNFVRDYYRNFTDYKYIFSIDDDIEQVRTIKDECPNILSIIAKGFEGCEAAGLNLWGINELHNTFYMKGSKEITTNLKYISGAFQGIIIDREKPQLYCDIDHGEDYQFSMEHFLRDGGVYRMNHYYLKTKYFITEGGICESMGGKIPRIENMNKNSEYLVERYGNMCKIKEAQWGNDIRLNGYFKLIESNN